MSEQLQLRRGTAAQIAAFTGAQGEVVVDTTNNRLVIQDGATPGGFAAAKLADVVARTAVPDSNYTALAADRSIAYTALTAARVVTLPASSSFPNGTTLTIFDESGACSSGNSITVNRTGSDVIDGSASGVAITSPFGYLALQSNGSGKWTVLDQSLSNLSAVGIGTAIDANNPLSVTANAVLFNQSSAGPSPGNIRVSLSKAASANTASFIFQDNFSERAEIGLTGDDNFHFKVSPNGSAFNTGILIDAATGAVTLGNARTAVSDAAYSALATDRLIAYTALSTARTVSLPAAGAFPTGVQLTILDESGACTVSSAITVSANGADTIGGSGSIVISKAYGFVALASNGSNKWTLVEQQGALGIQNSGSTNTSASGSGAFVNMTPNFVLPANFLQSGKAIRITACFSLTTGSAPPALSIELLAGSTVIAAMASITPAANAANVQHGVQFILQAASAPGSSANCQCCPVGQTNGYAAAAGEVSTTAMPVALATNAAITLQMATKWSATGTGTNSITLAQFIVESIN